MNDEELADICYECTGYGDDYRWDDEAGTLVSNCDTCWVTYYDTDGYYEDCEW